jgi:hypothetical protein
MMNTYARTRRLLQKVKNVMLATGNKSDLVYCGVVARAIAALLTGGEKMPLLMDSMKDSPDVAIDTIEGLDNVADAVLSMDPTAMYIVMYSFDEYSKSMSTSDHVACALVQGKNVHVLQSDKDTMTILEYTRFRTATFAAALKQLPNGKVWDKDMIAASEFLRKYAPSANMRECHDRIKRMCLDRGLMRRVKGRAWIHRVEGDIAQLQARVAATLEEGLVVVANGHSPWNLKK